MSEALEPDTGAFAARLDNAALGKQLGKTVRVLLRPYRHGDGNQDRTTQRAELARELLRPLLDSAGSEAEVGWRMWILVTALLHFIESAAHGTLPSPPPEGSISKEFEMRWQPKGGGP